MADNAIAVNGGSPVTFATDDIGGVQHARFKVGFGVDGAYVDASASNPLPVTGTVATGGLTDAQLRATPVPVSGTIATGGLTDAQLRATPVPVSGTVATGGLTDAQLRATAVPVSSPATGLFINVDGSAMSSANPLPIFNAGSTEILGSYLEDTPHTSGDLGLFMLGIRSDTDASTAGDGDYTALKLDEQGRLKVSTKPASYPDITGDITAVQATIGTPVVGGTVAGDVSRASNIMAFCTGTFSTVNCTFEGSLEATGETNWFGVQAVRSNANTIETTTGNLSAQPAYAWEMSVNALKRLRVRCTARTSGTQSWRFVQGTYATEPIPAAQVSATQPVSGTVTTALGNPTNANILNSAATTNGTVIKASAGNLYSIIASNNGAGNAYVKLHNSTTVTVGTTAVAMWILIPAGQTVRHDLGALGARFATGICLSITGAVGDTDTTAVAAGQVKVITSFI